MAKNRKKRTNRNPAQAPVKVHRYTAEEENKKDARKKLKIRSIAAAVLAGIAALLSLLIF